MNLAQHKVTEFMEAFGQATPLKPLLASEKVKRLREILIQEELDEFKHATTLEDIADAIADLLYVVYGSAAAYGIDIEDIFQEVHRSNMSKFWSDADLKNSPPSAPYLIETREVDGENYTIIKNKDGKIIKSPSYQPARVRRMLDTQLGLRKISPTN